MPFPTANEVVSYYLYGSGTPPANLASEALFRDLDATVPLDVDVQEYMNSATGPGRFAIGSEFELVQKFFEEKGNLVLAP